MEITDGGSQGIGRVSRNLSRKVEQRGYHLLHLLFGGLAVTDNGQLDLSRAIFADLNTVFCCSQQCYPARLAQLERALRIASEENFFQTDSMRLIARKDLLQTVVDPAQAAPLAVAR